MIGFRIVLVAMFVAVAGYTGIVIANHGPDLLSVFFGDIARLTWAGQFNLDFTCLLVLSGLWVAYRHRFGALGLVLGVCAMVGGVLFLSGYLLVASLRTRGDVDALLRRQDRLPVA
jgi:hypothetical protein